MKNTSKIDITNVKLQTFIPVDSAIESVEVSYENNVIFSVDKIEGQSEMVISFGLITPGMEISLNDFLTIIEKAKEKYLG